MRPSLPAAAIYSLPLNSKTAGVMLPMSRSFRVSHSRFDGVVIDELQILGRQGEDRVGPGTGLRAECTVAGFRVHVTRFPGDGDAGAAPNPRSPSLKGTNVFQMVQVHRIDTRWNAIAA